MKTSPRLDQYARYVPDDVLARVYHTAESLAGLRVLHINTTARGGGVAELLQALIPLMEELGIMHDRLIVPLDQRSNQFASQLGELIQGMADGELSQDEQLASLNALRHTPVLSNPQDHRADIYFVHDFQLTPLARFFPWMRPAIWMCHVDTAHPDPSAKAFIEQFLDDYTLCVFNSRPSIFPELPRSKVHVITPTIDPFSEKNRYLDAATGLEALVRCGIDTKRPLITQVSRFSTWKNPWQVIDVYRLVKQRLPSVQVALVGAMEAADDINAQQVLDNLRHYAGSDPDIHLLSDPVLIGHTEVNAFQRYSSVILQRSSREGFGLTMTEAMWKIQPVIATMATGPREQIRDGQDGYLVDDTGECATKTLQLLNDQNLRQEMGVEAHMRVKENYLLPFMALEYLDALVKARGH